MITPPVYPSHTDYTMQYRYLTVIILILQGLMLSGCDDLFGSKQDDTTDEIFDAGRIEPSLVNEAEYVPLFPFFTLTAAPQSFQAPRDIYVGYDELIYVVDEQGLHVLDRAGRPTLFIDIEGGATSVIQDRLLRVYVTARKDTMLNGRTWNLPVIQKYEGITTGSPRLTQTIWHPFDDDSRKFNRPDPLSTDELVEYTGISIRFDNSFYASRKGPVNDRTSVILPHNTLMVFLYDEDTDTHINRGAITALNPNQPNLRSSVFPTDVLTFIHPPQRTFSFDPVEDEEQFLVAQSPSLDAADINAGVAPLSFSVISVLAVPTSSGIDYRPDSDLLLVAANPDRGNGFLYDEFKFTNPSDMTFAGDGTNYIFVVDSVKDSLFVFTSGGVEGVAPPPGSSSTIPVIVSFGGSGDGALQFESPQGVAYFDRIVYVADTGNNRISRFRLNTDFE